MTVTDQIKILDRKIKQNETQYELDRKAGKISALSSNNLDKYKYLTGEDLGLKLSTVEETKFEYSPLGKVFNKGVSEEDRKEGLLKRLEKIKDKNEELLNKFNTTSKASKNKINIQNKNLTYDSKHSFVKYKDIEDIKELSLDSMYKKLNKYDEITSLNNNNPRKKNTKELKNEVLSNVRDLYNELCYIYKGKYSKEINSIDTKNREKLDYKKLRLSGDLYSSEEEQEGKTTTDPNAFNEQINKEEKTITDAIAFNEQINKEETGENTELFKKHFSFQRPSDMLKFLYNANTNQNNELVSVLNSGLKDLKEKIKEMSEEEIKIEKPDKIVKIVDEILRFNKGKQEGQGIKILTPSQMLSRLPISLAQLEAGNNSEELKNEIRQLLYSLYRSKYITKQVYNNLIKPI